jgi:phage terminase small subunit
MPSDRGTQAVASTGPLANARHERFCQELAKGASQTDAYLAAGFRGNRSKVRHRASALAKRPGVAARTTALKQAAASLAAVKGADVLRELARLGMADLRDVATWEGDGLTFRPSSQLTEDAARAVKRVRSRKSVRRTVDGEVIEDVRLEVEMHDKKGPLDSLGKAFGLFRDQAATNPITVMVVGPEQLREGTQKGHTDHVPDPL